MIQEIRAELLLNSLYPDHDKHWLVTAQGTFYRNYNSDLMSIDSEAGTVRLARDGLLKLLPSELISPPDELRGEGFDKNRDKMLWRQTLLREAFAPFDTVQFAHSMNIERQVSSLLSERDEYILSNYFGINLDDTTDPLVRKAASLLPRISSLRGDLGMVRNLLSVLLQSPVEMDLSHRYSQTCSDRNWMPMVRYYVIKPGLSAAAYNEAMAALRPLADFVREWFIPCDIVSRIEYRQHKDSGNVQQQVVLDYNTETV